MTRTSGSVEGSWTKGPGPLRRGVLLHVALVTLLSHALTPNLRAAESPRIRQEPQITTGSWRTIETPHFRVHFAAEYEEWATYAAGRLESVRDAVVKEVGFAPTPVVDVIVMNPESEANGSALPFLDGPRMIFYTEPPSPDDQLGSGHWIDLLSVHETTHVMHMLRPSRSRAGKIVEKLLTPLSTITISSPRWVLEGYATVIEGRLTGAGRPNSAIRALILRQWALNGRLPTYEQLDSDTRFLGMRMAYFVGSAFLEWLEKRQGPESLRNLWSRSTARKWDAFDDSFADVFGERPERLYGRFVAELTAAAVSIDRSAPLRAGELFQETAGTTGDPAASPDGSQLAVVRRRTGKPDELVIWSTTPPVEEERKREKRVAEILRRDPDDVRPARVAPVDREELHALVMSDRGDIEDPRWSRDGKSIIFAHRAPDARGVLHYDLYRWDFDRVTPITRYADVRDADPMPDGRTAVAVRSRFGKMQLVTVDLESGAITPRTEPSIHVVLSHPRVSLDGKRLAYVAHREGKWRLVIDDHELSLPGDPQSPEWITPDELVVTLSADGFAELYRVKVDGSAVQISNTAGGAFSPAPAPEGRIFFTSLEPEGYVVRLLRDLGPVAARPPFSADLAPAIPLRPTAPAAFTSVAVTSRPYGAGRQELAWVAGLNLAPDQRSFDFGLRLGDVVGRLDTLLIGSLGDDESPSGLALGTAWRGFPVELQAHLFRTGEVCAGTSPMCLPANGLELRGTWTRRMPQSRLTIEAGTLTDDLLFASAGFSAFQSAGDVRIGESVTVDITDERIRGSAAADVSLGALRVGGRYQMDRGSEVAVGGLPSAVMPRSAYSSWVLDPALPPGTLVGDDYDGWKMEASVGAVAAFYQRHEVEGNELSLAGLGVTLSSAPLPILKLPGLDFTAGVARVLDSPLEGEVKWWFGMRWRP